MVSEHRWEQDLQRLRELGDRVFGPGMLARVAAVEPDPELLAACLRTLRTAYASVPMPTLDPRTNGLVELSAIVLGAHGNYTREIWDTIVLRVGHPAAYFDLVPLLNTLLRGDDDTFFALLLEALESEDPEHMVRGLSLLRAAYSARFGFHLTGAQVQAIDAAVATRKALGTDDSHLQSALAHYVSPAAR